MTRLSGQPAEAGPSYAHVSETPGLEVTPENLRMMHTRYRWVSEQVQGDVIELAAGPAVGWSYLEPVSDRLVGIDIDPVLVRQASRTLGPTSDLCVADATTLPFAGSSFDAALLFEAIYYLPNPVRGLREIQRVLSPGGELYISTANPERAGFVRSPGSHTYPDADTLVEWLIDVGFVDVQLFGAYPADADGLMGSVLRRGIEIADRLHLIPRSLEGRARFKRLLHGELTTIPDRIEPGEMDTEDPQPIDPRESPSWTVLYARGEAP